MTTMRTLAAIYTFPLLSIAVVPASAQTYDLSWYTIDGGGITLASGGGYELSCSLGQPDASDVLLSGGEYTLEGGFLPGATICFGDLDGNSAVDIADLARLLSNFGTPAGASAQDGDLDGDGDVDLSDLTALLARFGTTC